MHSIYSCKPTTSKLRGLKQQFIISCNSAGWQGRSSAPSPELTCEAVFGWHISWGLHSVGIHVTGKPLSTWPPSRMPSWRGGPRAAFKEDKGSGTRTSHSIRQNKKLGQLRLKGWDNRPPLMGWTTKYCSHTYQPTTDALIQAQMFTFCHLNLTKNDMAEMKMPYSCILKYFGCTKLNFFYRETLWYLPYCDCQIY